MKISLFHKNKTTTGAAGAARWQAGPAYVRGTKYDVRFGEFPRLRASVAPMYNFDNVIAAQFLN